MLCHDSSCPILTNLVLLWCLYFGSGARMSGSTGSVIFLVLTFWAVLEDKVLSCISKHANQEDSDQTAHVCSLTRIFPV